MLTPKRHSLPFSLFLTLLFGFLFQTWAMSEFAELPDRHPLDETVYERFVLENGLRVLLVSDPKLDKAAASMSVGVGSLSDPKERQGLAHFLEHMLFLGTEKYPDPSEYGNYLRSNGGYANAYTAPDHTNYLFEVFPFAFEGALDRFAQFFIAPLFSEELIERELNAVHSEHQGNLENDSWRTWQLWRNYYNPEHPSNHFSTGNMDTLGDISSEEFIQFYHQHYSANQMALALVAPNSLAEMRSWVEEYFSGIENRGFERISYPEDYMLPSDQFRLLKLRPIMDLRSLTIEFPMPDTISGFTSRSPDLISYILGYEGKGSLLSLLKDKDWATGLSAFFYEITPDYSSLFISVELTPSGLDHYRDVMRMVFGYLELMRESPFPLQLFQEQAIMARLNELYADRGEGSGRATALANQIMRYSLELAERVPHLWETPDEASYFDLLQRAQPQTMMTPLRSHSFETDRTEHHYGTPYSYWEGDPEFLVELTQQRPHPSTSLPSPNPFVPRQVQLLSETPIKLLDEPGLQLYYLQDREFQRPKVAAHFKIRHPGEFATLENTVLKDFYASAVMEGLNELAYPARMAGLGYSISAGVDGLTLSLSGYNESAMSLLEAIIYEMATVSISPERFEAIKERSIRSLENFPRTDAWRIAREAKNQLMHEVRFTPEEQLEVARTITLEQLRAFPGSLFAATHIEALVHGNVSQQEALHATTGLMEGLKMGRIPREEVFSNGLLVLEAGEDATKVKDLLVNNSALWLEFALGMNTPEIRASSLILNNYVAEPVFSELRTNQQLGYVVAGFTGREKDRQSLYIVIQSAEYPANELLARSESFLSTLPEALAKLDAADFERMRQAAIARMEERPKNIAEKAGEFFNQAFELKGNFNYKEETLSALRSISQESVADLLATAVNPETASRRIILAFGRDHADYEPIAETIESLSEWKASRSFE